MFGFGKPYTQQLLETKNATAFVEGIIQNPKRFFNEAEKDPQGVLRRMAGVLELANNQLGQRAILLSLTSALNVAAKDKNAPPGAPALAQKLSDDLTRALKMAGE